MVLIFVITSLKETVDPKEWRTLWMRANWWMYWTALITSPHMKTRTVTGCWLAMSPGSEFLSSSSSPPSFNILLRHFHQSFFFPFFFSLFLKWFFLFIYKFLGSTRMFVESCKRLRIMKGKEAVGLGKFLQLEMKNH